LALWWLNAGASKLSISAGAMDREYREDVAGD
jgi:hypothetical protein